MGKVSSLAVVRALVLQLSALARRLGMLAPPGAILTTRGARTRKIADYLWIPPPQGTIQAEHVLVLWTTMKQVVGLSVLQLLGVVE